jgi:hypothetical protein
MLKSAYGEECLSRISVFEWHKSTKEGESRYKTINGKADLQLPEHKNLCRKNTVNGKFYKEVSKRLISRVHRVRPEFQESGSWYLLHDSGPAYSSRVVSPFLAKRWIPRVIPSTLLP